MFNYIFARHIINTDRFQKWFRSFAVYSYEVNYHVYFKFLKFNSAKKILKILVSSK